MTTYRGYSISSAGGEFFVRPISGSGFYGPFPSLDCVKMAIDRYILYLWA